MSRDRKTTTESRNASIPTAPDYVRNGLQGLTGAILNLGDKDPLSYVPGASGLQRQAFGMGNRLAERYGMSAPSQPNYIPMPSQPLDISGGGSGGGGGLFDQLGVSTPQTPDYLAYVNNHSDLGRHYDSLSSSQHAHIARSLGLPEGGNVTREQFGQYHWNQHGSGEPKRQSPYGDSGGGTPAPSASTSAGKTTPPFVNVGGGAYMPTNDGTIAPITTTGSNPSPTTSSGFTGINPLTNYRDASSIARDVAGAGPNSVDRAATYNPAQIGRDPAFTGVNSAGSASTYDPTMVDPSAITKANAGSVASHSLLTNLDSYMSPYTEDVVDTTLAGFDENAGRLKAQQAAAAAANGGFGGSRYGVSEAILRGELARERAGTEAGLRDQAFQVGAGLSADDANRRQAASTTNANLLTQTNIANMGADMQRALADQNAANQAGQFNAASRNNMSQFNAGQADSAMNRILQGALADQNAANDAGRFNAGSINDLRKFNASQADTALDRALRSADSLRATGNTAQTNERADLGLLAQLGQQERSIQQQQAGADVALLSTIAQLFGDLPFEQVTGVSGSGTQTSRSQPGLLDYINGYSNYVSANSNALSAIAGMG